MGCFRDRHVTGWSSLFVDMELTLAEVQDQDQPLFEALAAGDGGALDELMQRHARFVRGVVYAVLGQSRDLDDVVQQVWLLVWRRAKTLDDPRRWKPWLYRLARNAAIDAGRKKTRRRGLWQRMTETFDAAKQTEREPHERLIVEEQHAKVLDAIEGLPAIYREPFVLRHMEEHSYRAIAEMMDLPIDTVETRLVRARRLLRQMLDGVDRKSK